MKTKNQLKGIFKKIITRNRWTPEIGLIEGNEALMALFNADDSRITDKYFYYKIQTYKQKYQCSFYELVNVYHQAIHEVSAKYAIMQQEHDAHFN